MEDKKEEKIEMEAEDKTAKVEMDDKEEEKIKIEAED